MYYATVVDIMLLMHAVVSVSECYPDQSPSLVWNNQDGGGAVAQRVEHWTCDQQVVGSITARGKAA